MISANHVLAQEGILTSFSIAKRVTARDTKRLRDKIKSSKIDASKLEELLKQSVTEEARSTIKEGKIPGLVLDKASNISTTTDPAEDKRIMELTYFSSLIAKKVTEKKMDKYYACYVINALVNMLGLNDNDFEQFHKRFAKYKNGGKDPEPSDDSADPIY